jgi:predicted esterase
VEAWREAAALLAGGDAAAAAARLRRGLEEGDLWRVSLLQDPDLAPLLDDPGCREAIEEARRRAAALGARPQVLVEPAAGAGLHPILLVLHGARSTAAATLPLWLPARDLGYTVAAGQASQPASADGFCWDPPRERVWEDLRAIVAGLPPHARVVLGGFSQGAWVALNAALRGDLVTPAGVIMVGAFAPEPLRLEPTARRLRVAILSGSEDPYATRIEALRAALIERGHHVTVQLVPGLGHAHPDDFAARLPGLLRAAARQQP